MGRGLCTLVLLFLTVASTVVMEGEGFIEHTHTQTQEARGTCSQVRTRSKIGRRNTHTHTHKHTHTHTHTYAHIPPLINLFHISASNGQGSSDLTLCTPQLDGRLYRLQKLRFSVSQTAHYKNGTWGGETNQQTKNSFLLPLFSPPRTFSHLSL